jgi:DNA polymerase III epsilon subunit-like protein
VVWFDTETGGFNPDRHPVIELGALITDPLGQILHGEFHTLIAPWCEVPKDAAAVNGYCPEDWAGAPSLRDAMAAWRAWLPPGPFVSAGYNVPFDLRFLHASFARAKVPMPEWSKDRALDVCTVAKQKLRGATAGHKLTTVAAHFGLDTTGAHSAFADIRLTREVFLRLTRG